MPGWAISALRVPGSSWKYSEPNAEHAPMKNGDERFFYGELISYAPVTGDIDWKVFDTGSLNGLRIELHEFHNLERHINFYGKAEFARFGSG